MFGRKFTYDYSKFNGIPQPQYFPLPKPIMAYIVATLKSPKVHKKLYQSCKYFYSVNRVVNASHVYCAHLRHDNYPFKFYLDYGFFVDPYKQSNFLSEHLSKVYACCLINLNLHNQNISHDDFVFLVAGGRIRNLQLQNVIIKDKNSGKTTPLEAIFEMVPEIKSFEL